MTETALHRLGKNSTGKCVKGCQFEHTPTVQQKPLPQVLGGNGIMDLVWQRYLIRQPIQLLKLPVFLRAVRAGRTSRANLRSNDVVFDRVLNQFGVGLAFKSSMIRYL